MIISRYIGKELIAATAAITAILLLVIVSGRFVDYLADAAAGDIPADLLGYLFLFRLPGFIQLILPLGFFVALMLTYGRLYVDSEMVVLQACGLGQFKLLCAAWMPTVLVIIIVAWFSIVLAPSGESRLKAMMDQNTASTGISALAAGRFQYVGDGITVYVRELSEDKTQMKDVFVVQQTEEDGLSMNSLALADTAFVRNIDGGVRYLVLKNGRQFRSAAGEKRRSQVAFGEFALKMAQSKGQEIRPTSADALPTHKLWSDPTPENIAAFHWRIAMPLMVFISAVFGFSLSRTNPRRGRYGKLLPGIVLFFLYFTALGLVRGVIENGQLSGAIGLWPVHGLMLLIAISLMYQDVWVNKWASRRRVIVAQ